MINLRLRELRVASNITQADIAHFLKITRAAYSLYESGKRQMNYETLDLLAKYHDVSIDYLLGRSEAPIRLEEKDKEILEHYHQLDERGKDNVISVLEHEISVQAGYAKLKKKVF